MKTHRAIHLYTCPSCNKLTTSNCSGKSTLIVRKVEGGDILLALIIEHGQAALEALPIDVVTEERKLGQSTAHKLLERGEINRVIDVVPPDPLSKLVLLDDFLCQAQFSLRQWILRRSSSLGWLVWFVLSGLGLSLSLSSRRFVCLVCLPVRLVLGGCLLVGAILSVLDLVVLGRLALALLLLVVLLPLRAHRKLITATENLGSEC